jgi:hypothetical protein
VNDNHEEKWTVHTVVNNEVSDSRDKRWQSVLQALIPINQEFINERGEPVEGCELVSVRQS